MTNRRLHGAVYSGKQRGVIMTSLVMLYFLQAEVRFLPSPLMQELAEDFAVPLTVVGNLLSVCAVAAAAATFGISFVVEWLGSVRLMAIGALCTAVAGLCTAWTQLFSVAVLASVFCGVCQGVLECAGMVLVAELYDEKHRVFVCSVVCAVSQISFSASYILPVLLYKIVGGWRHLELIWGILALLTSVVLFVCGKGKTPADVSGQPPKSKVPGILQALRFRFVFLTVLAMAVFIWVNNHFAIYLPTYLMEVRKFSETQAGMTTGIMYAGGFAGAMVLGLFPERGRKRIYRAAPFLMLGCALVLCLCGSYPAILAGAVGFTFAYQMWVPLSLSYFMKLDGITTSSLAGATALFNGTGHLFTGFIPAVFTWELQYTGMSQVYLFTVCLLIFPIVLTTLAGRDIS